MTGSSDLEQRAFEHHALELVERFIQRFNDVSCACRVDEPTDDSLPDGRMDALLYRAAEAVDEPQWRMDLCLLRFVTPRAAVLVQEDGQSSPAQLRKLVRRQVMEFHLVDECGDNVLDKQQCHQIDRQVALILRILDYARRRQNCDSDWSHVPVTPLMYG